MNLSFTKPAVDDLRVRARRVVKRRRAAVTWPFDVVETERLFWPEPVWTRIQELKELDFHEFHKTRTEYFFVPEELLGYSNARPHGRGRGMLVQLDTTGGVDGLLVGRLGVLVHGMTPELQVDHPRIDDFLEWARASARIDRENFIVCKTVDACLDLMTTWPQFYKSFPRADVFFEQVLDTASVPSFLAYPLRVTLGKDPSTTRARNPPPELKHKLDTARATIESVLSQVALLPDNAVERMPTPWRETWWYMADY